VHSQRCQRHIVRAIEKYAPVLFRVATHGVSGDYTARREPTSQVSIYPSAYALKRGMHGKGGSLHGSDLYAFPPQNRVNVKIGTADEKYPGYSANNAAVSLREAVTPELSERRHEFTAAEIDLSHTVNSVARRCHCSMIKRIGMSESHLESHLAHTECHKFPTDWHESKMS